MPHQPTPKAHVVNFGDGIDLSHELIRLIRTGRKTAASGALEDFQSKGDPVPEAGDYVIAADSDFVPWVLLRLTDVQLMPFNQIPAEFIAAEGEAPDGEEWEDAHETYYRRKGYFSPDMMVICMRFIFVADLVPAQNGVAAP